MPCPEKGGISPPCPWKLPNSIYWTLKGNYKQGSAEKTMVNDHVLFVFVYWPKFVQALQWCASSLTGAESYGMDWGLTKQSGRTFGGSGRPFLAVGEFTTWQKDPQNMGGKVSKHDKEVIFIQFLFAWTESLGGVHPRDSFESGALCRFSWKQGFLNCHLWQSSNYQLKQSEAWCLGGADGVITST